MICAICAASGAGPAGRTAAAAIAAASAASSRIAQSALRGVEMEAVAAGQMPFGAHEPAARGQGMALFQRTAPDPGQPVREYRSHGRVSARNPGGQRHAAVKRRVHRAGFTGFDKDGRRWRSLQKDMQLINRRLVKSRSHLAATAQESRISINVMETMQHTHRKIVSSTDLLLHAVPKLPRPEISESDEALLHQHFIGLQQELRHTARLLKACAWKDPLTPSRVMSAGCSLPPAWLA